MLPASIGSLQWLTALSIVSSGVTGQLPPALGQLRSLKMVWLDHNRALGGEIPMTFAQLNLTVLEVRSSSDPPGGFGWTCC